MVIVGLRADFYARFTSHRGLRTALQEGQALVGPMTSDELRRAIERPAIEARLSLEPGLADTMLSELGQEPGALPLLSHALLETWERRRGRRLTIAGYFESGGVRRAIARTADRLFDEEFTPDQQRYARDIFVRLTELGEGTEDTRRRTTLDELVPSADARASVEAVVNTLATHRLLTVGEDSVEVAHEALIRHWPRLRTWLNEDRQALRVQRRLTEAAGEWQRLGRDAGLLYRGARLAEAREWRASRKPALNPLERDFLRASSELAERESRSAKRRLLTLAAVLLIGLAATSTAAVVALRQGDAAQEERDTAEQQRAVATSRELAAAATAQRASDPELALLLAREAARAAPTDQAHEALSTALLESRLRPPVVNSAGVVFSPDRRTFVASVQRGTDEDFESWLEVWSMASRRRIAELGPETDSPAFSPDGGFLATVSGRGFEVWDTTTWKSVARLGQSGPPLSSVAIGPGGDQMIAIADDGAARAWDVHSGKRWRRLRPRRGVARLPPRSVLTVRSR